MVDLRLGEGELLVRRAKRGGSRVQPLPLAIRPRLQVYLAARGVLAGRGERPGGRLLLTRRGVSVVAVQRLLGHADLDTTARYVGLGQEDLRRAVAVLEFAH